MYNQNNSDHKSPAAPPMSPRISFSNDFVESSSHSQIRDAQISSDFEFSEKNYTVMSADELFFKGRLLSFKGSCQKSTTLRDELQNEDDNGDGDFTLSPPKNPTRWKGFLGLTKSHVGSKKSDKGDNAMSNAIRIHRILLNE